MTSELVANRERLIVALDVASGAEALALVDRLGDSVARYKVGLELFVSAGPALVEELVRRGKRVFVDLKLHDIPETVGRAAEAVARLGADLLTVHAAGGGEMMKRAVDGARRGNPATRVLAVTVLTSSSTEGLHADGTDVAHTAESLVLHRAARAQEAGCAGVIASPLELSALRGRVPREFLVVTPGIRPSAVADDQKRVATPKAARAAGADAIVVGRPIRDAADPLAMTRQILADLD